jgi:hypothetical protein
VRERGIEDVIESEKMQLRDRERRCERERERKM